MGSLPAELRTMYMLIEHLAGHNRKHRKRN